MQTLKKSIFVIFLVLLFACSKDEDTKPKALLNENPNSPENAYIHFQTTLGNEGDKSSIFRVLEFSNGEFAYYGNRFGSYVIGLLDAYGKPIVEKAPSFKIRNFRIIKEGAFSLKNALVCVGGYNSIPDVNSNLDEGRIAVYTQSMTVLDDRHIPAPAGYQVWFNDLELATTSNNSFVFIAVGGARKGDLEYPFSAKLSIDPNGLVSFQESRIYTNLPLKRFVNISGISENNFVVSGNNLISNSGKTETTSISVYQLDRASLSVVWEKGFSVFSSGLKTSHTVGSTIVSIGKIYVAGTSETTDFPKRNKPDNENYWDMGFVACFSVIDGSLLWKTNVNLTEYSERLYSLVVKNDFIYAAGTQASFYSGENNFGNGLIAKLDLSGRLVATTTFGGKDYQTSFNCITTTGQHLLAGGYTKYKTDSYQGYFVLSKF